MSFTLRRKQNVNRVGGRHRWQIASSKAESSWEVIPNYLDYMSDLPGARRWQRFAGALVGRSFLRETRRGNTSGRTGIDFSTLDNVGSRAASPVHLLHQPKANYKHVQSKMKLTQSKQKPPASAKSSRSGTGFDEHYTKGDHSSNFKSPASRHRNRRASDFLAASLGIFSESSGSHQVNSTPMHRSSPRSLIGGADMSGNEAQHLSQAR